MAAHGAAFLRPSSALLSAATSAAAEHARSARRAITRFSHPGSFSLPHSNLSAASSRVSRNLSSFRAHYALLLWFSLLASLFPSHRASMLFLMLISKLLLSYALLLRLFPNSPLLRRILQPRIVFGLFLALVMLQLVLAQAVPSLLLAIAAAAPVVAAHALFRTPDALLGAGAGDIGNQMLMLPIFEKKEADSESGGGLASDRSA